MRRALACLALLPFGLGFACGGSQDGTFFSPAPEGAGGSESAGSGGSAGSESAGTAGSESAGAGGSVGGSAGGPAGASGTAGAPGGASGAAGKSGGAAGSGASGAPTCPFLQPLEGTSCGGTLACDYPMGPNCSTKCACTSGKWACDQTCSSGCPQVVANGLQCPSAGQVCKDVCANDCACNGGKWACSGVCGGTGCPAMPPVCGAACSFPELTKTCPCVENGGPGSCQCTGTVSPKWTCSSAAACPLTPISCNAPCNTTASGCTCSAGGLNIASCGCKSDGAMQLWLCEGVPPPCPKSEPDQNAACLQPGQSCTYGSKKCGCEPSGWKCGG